MINRWFSNSYMDQNCIKNFFKCTFPHLRFFLGRATHMDCKLCLTVIFWFSDPIYLITILQVTTRLISLKRFIIYLFVHFWLCHMACGILVPQPGIILRPQHWVLTTGLLGNSKITSLNRRPLNTSLFQGLCESPYL